MISTFDLTLMGGLISLGGLVFFFVGTRRRTAGSPFASRERQEVDQRRDSLQRGEFMAGMRWLTVGVLVLFVGVTRGTASGYLFDLWTDILFHVGILSACWAATAYRVKRLAHQPVADSEPARMVPASDGVNIPR